MAEVAIAELIRLNSAETGPTEPPFSIEIDSLKTRYMRRRFRLDAVASSTGDYTRVSHDKKANTTGRTPYSFCGKPVIVSTIENSVLDATTGRWLGYLYVSDNGTKHVYGPMNKGMLNDSRIHI